MQGCSDGGACGTKQHRASERHKGRALGCPACACPGGGCAAWPGNCGKPVSFGGALGAPCTAHKRVCCPAACLCDWHPGGTAGAAQLASGLAAHSRATCPAGRNSTAGREAASQLQFANRVRLLRTTSAKVEALRGLVSRRRLAESAGCSGADVLACACEPAPALPCSVPGRSGLGNF